MTNKRSRAPLEDIFKPLLFEACGGRCVDCGVEGGELQLGHIQRREDDGPDTLENFQPLCATCNGRHNAEFTMTDLRPADWRDRFVKLLAGALQTELYVKGCAYPTPKKEGGMETPEAIQPTENKTLIPWDGATFSLNNSLSRTLSRAGVPSLDTWTGLVNALIKKGADHDAPIPPPEELLKSKMIQQVRRLGCDDFIRAGREFLRQGKWFDGRFRLMTSPWKTFSDNIDHYLRESAEYARKLAAQEANQKAIDEQIQAQVRIEILERKQLTVKACLNLNWPGISSDDAALIDRLRQITGDVSDDDYKLANELCSRHREYFKHTAKAKAQELLKRLGEKIFDGELEMQRGTVAERNASTEEWKSIHELVKNASDNDPRLETLKPRLAALIKPRRKKQES
jgi:HNH endonuclease